jgi:hypothetical protein
MLMLAQLHTEYKIGQRKKLLDGSNSCFLDRDQLSLLIKHTYKIAAILALSIQFRIAGTTEHLCNWISGVNGN